MTHFTIISYVSLNGGGLLFDCFGFVVSFLCLMFVIWVIVYYVLCLLLIAFGLCLDFWVCCLIDFTF